MQQKAFKQLISLTKNEIACLLDHRIVLMTKRKHVPLMPISSSKAAKSIAQSCNATYYCKAALA
jgi:hypothetical protein